MSDSTRLRSVVVKSLRSYVNALIAARTAQWLQPKLGTDFPYSNKPVGFPRPRRSLLYDDEVFCLSKLDPLGILGWSERRNDVADVFLTIRRKGRVV